MMARRKEPLSVCCIHCGATLNFEVDSNYYGDSDLIVDEIKEHGWDLADKGITCNKCLKKVIG